MEISKERQIYITGHTGMAGKSLTQYLNHKGYTNILVESSEKLDLRNQKSVDAFVGKYNPERHRRPYVAHWDKLLHIINIKQPNK